MSIIQRFNSTKSLLLGKEQTDHFYVDPVEEFYLNHTTIANLPHQRTYVVAKLKVSGGRDAQSTGTSTSNIQKAHYVSAVSKHRGVAYFDIVVIFQSIFNVVEELKAIQSI